MAGRRSWTIAGMDEQLRGEAVAAAEQAGVPVHEWIEQAVRQALQGEPEPAPPAGVEIDELEAMVRRVVVEELQPVKEALARPGVPAMAPGLPDGGSPVGYMRERLRQRRAR